MEWPRSHKEKLKASGGYFNKIFTPNNHKLNDEKNIKLHMSPNKLLLKMFTLKEQKIKLGFQKLNHYV